MTMSSVPLYDTIRYDTIGYLTCAQQLTKARLIYRTKAKNKNIENVGKN